MKCEHTSANCQGIYTMQVWGGAPPQLRGDAEGHRGEQEGEQRYRVRTREEQGGLIPPLL
jgi:hypothetical protein